MKTLSIPFLRLVFGLAVAAMAAGILGETNVCAQADGTPLWTNRYNGPGNGDDTAYAMAVDGNGNVIVTGSSYGLGTFDDYATIKYSSAGVPLWTNRYNGPGNFYDTANAVAVDDSGNVSVTGSAFNGDGDDYATIKYSSAGVPLWLRRYGLPGVNSTSIPVALAVDGSGNVIATGESHIFGDDPDYVTIKYSGAGVPLWTNRYDGPANTNDYATAVAVDGSGNVVVTGDSDDSNGWSDYATIKYSSAGVPLWTNRYNGPGNQADYANGLVVDKAGAVFVTGNSWRGVSGYDFATIKYSSEGVPLWTNRYNGSGNGDDYPWAIAVDSSGNVFVTGSSSASGGGSDYVTIKYSNAGIPLWTNRYNGTSHGYATARGIAVDGGGNVFVTGYSSSGAVVSSDYVTIKYSSAGVPLWTNAYNGPGNGYDSPKAIAVEIGGNVVVTGISTGANGDYDYVTIKYLSVSRPLLSIARTTTNMLVLSWPSSAADFTLQQNANTTSANWTAVGITPADDGTNKTVIVDPPEENRFYRLFRP